MNDVEHADDLVQETLTRALGKLRLWRINSDMRAWLFTIMHNQFVDEFRRVQKRPDRKSLEDDGVQEPVSTANPEQNLRIRDIEAALRQLPVEQRAVLLLVSLEGLSYMETAKILDIRIGTVMSRLHRARAQLCHLMDGAPTGKVRSIRSVK